MFKVNNRGARHCSGVFINFEYIWHVVLVFGFCFWGGFLAHFKRVNGRWNTVLS